MQNIAEFAGIISIADNVKLQFFTRLEESMLYFRFENGNFLSCESMELCFNLRIVDNSNFEEIIFKNFHLSKVKLFWSDNHLRTIRIRTDIQQIRLIIIGTDDIDVQRKRNFT